MRGLRCCSLGWLAWLLLGPAAAGAQSDEDVLSAVYGDKGFVSIATGTRQPVTRAPAVATVITAQEIEAIGATDLDQVLETVPGLHVSPLQRDAAAARGLHRRQPANREPHRVEPQRTATAQLRLRVFRAVRLARRIAQVLRARARAMAASITWRLLSSNCGSLIFDSCARLSSLTCALVSRRCSCSCLSRSKRKLWNA